MISLPVTFWKDIEGPLNHILYGDTDSLFIKIPKKFNSIEESITESEIIASEINSLITNYFNSILLPKMGVDIKYNETFFKTELTANSMMLLDTKKMYAYNLTSKEHKIFNPPKAEYTGLPIKKSDTVPFLKDFLKELIIDIVFNEDTKKQRLLELLVGKYHNILNSKLENYDFTYISAPAKWTDQDYKSEIAPIIGMRLYNMLVDKDVFRPGSFGIHFPIELKKKNMIELHPNKNKSKYYLGNTPISRVNFITIPYNYSKSEIKQLLEDYEISITNAIFWEWSRLIGNEVAQKIFKLIKGDSK